MAAGVPVVDFGGVMGADRAVIVEQTGRALEEWGFVAITGHGIDPHLLTRAYAEAAALFAEPVESKRAHETPEDGRQRGYTSFGVEHAKDQPAADLKEFWHVGRELPASHPASVHIPRNRFPADRPAFEATMTSLFEQSEAFAQQLLSVIAEHLELPADWFVPRTAFGNSVLRVIHYPPVLAAEAGAVRAAAHEDINLLTVLPVSTAPGLELLTRSGEWLAVTPPAGAVLCDTGDMMQAITGGRLPATTHRVVNPPQGNASSRYSLPFFMHPHPDCPLDPIEGSGRSITAQAFLEERLRETGMA